MPAMLDDPTSPPIYRTSGQPPFPAPNDPLPSHIESRQVTLRDRTTTASLIPFSSPAQVPQRLTACLCELLNREIDKGDTYPMMEPMPLSNFAPYWFSNFGAVMVLGDIRSAEEVSEMEHRGADWAKECLGSFYIKPNYPGRSSHVCNGGFLVTDAARNRGVGRLMGEGYLEWAPKLGYTYSVFNLVYETNVHSLRIWDSLGFKRIGRVKGCGNLKSYPDVPIDAIIYGRELNSEGDEYVSEERFDKIRFYLKTGTYPNGSDRAEKSRLRSAATHYRLEPGEGDEEKLMLKGKEVISDPHQQYMIARNMHQTVHAGINKTTAIIAEKYHWVRIKETVSAAIRNCPDCKESASPNRSLLHQLKSTFPSAVYPRAVPGGLPPSSNTSGPSHLGRTTVTAGADNDPTDATPTSSSLMQQQQQQQQQQQGPAPTAQMAFGTTDDQGYSDLPVDPQIMQGIQHHHHPHAWHSDPNADVGMNGSHDEAAAAAAAAAVAVDGLSEQQQHSPTDVDVRLRESLEAQMMSDEQHHHHHHQAFARSGR